MGNLRVRKVGKAWLGLIYVSSREYSVAMGMGMRNQLGFRNITWRYGLRRM